MTKSGPGSKRISKPFLVHTPCLRNSGVVKHALVACRAVLNRVAFCGLVWALSFFAISCKRGSEPQFSGTIEADEIRVASRHGGRVEMLGAWEGDSLTNGQLIVALDAAELQAQRDKAAALLAELKAGPRQEEIAASMREWEAVVAELDFARVEAKRAKELLEQRAISESDRDRAVTRAISLERNAAAAQSRYELLQAGTRQEQIAQAAAALAEIDARFREMRVVAPTNSVLEVLHVRKGDVLAPNQPIATLIVPQRIWVRVYVPQPMLGQLTLGEKVAVRVDSFPGREFAGTIEQINRAAEFTPRNVQTAAERIKQVFGIKIALENSEGLLRAGMGAEAVFSH
jgi:HlyD family secretion protein